jgi:hypothetical protein
MGWSWGVIILPGLGLIARSLWQAGWEGDSGGQMRAHKTQNICIYSAIHTACMTY